MAVYFFDSSALVKRHVSESGSAWVRSLTRAKAAHTLYIARITAVEITLRDHTAAASLQPRQGQSSLTSAATRPSVISSWR